MDKYDDVLNMKLINNKLAYVASKTGKGMVVVYDGQEETWYPSVNCDLTEIEGKLAYTAKTEDEYFNKIIWLVYDKKAIKFNEADNKLKEAVNKTTDTCMSTSSDGENDATKPYSMSFTNRSVEINGKPAIINDTKDDYYVSFDGRNDNIYDEIRYLTNVGGKIAYAARKDNAIFIVFDGKEGKRYRGRNLLNTITYLRDLAGKPIYKVIADSIKSTEFFVYDEVEYGTHEFVHNPVIFNGKLAYVARSILREFIMYEDKQMSREYYTIYKMISTQNKLFYIVHKPPLYDGEKVSNNKILLEVEYNPQVNVQTSESMPTRLIGENYSSSSTTEAASQNKTPPTIIFLGITVGAVVLVTGGGVWWWNRKKK